MNASLRAQSHPGAGLGSVKADGVGVGADGGGASAAVTWQLPEEVPVGILANSRAIAVMMATPADLGDFARGFVVSEGILPNLKGVRSALIVPQDEGVAVDLAVDDDVLATARFPERTIEGRAGCGVCGVEDLRSVVRDLPPVPAGPRVSPAAILKAAAALPAHQPMNRVNRSMHAAAWCTRDGEIKLVREDVGRHNGLDKLIGALLSADEDLRQGFVLVSSRCSFELVQKVVTVGIGTLVSVSGPTSLALEIARRSGVQLAALDRDRVVDFTA